MSHQNLVVGTIFLILRLKKGEVVVKLVLVLIQCIKVKKKHMQSCNNAGSVLTGASEVVEDFWHISFLTFSRICLKNKKTQNINSHHCR